MSDEARTVLAQFRRATRTSAAQHAATWARLQDRIAADEAPQSFEAPAPIAARRGVAIALAVAAAVALAVWAWSWRDSAVEGDAGARSQAIDDAARAPAIGEATPTPAMRNHDPAATSPAPPDLVAPAPVPVQSPGVVAPIVPAPHASASEPARTDDDDDDDALAREVTLMRSAREAALAGTLDRAVELTDAHAREFPRGKLAHERWALRIDLLCRLDRNDAARATALGFASAYPESTLAAERRTTPCPHKP
jgi:hypothetical protein